jgi:glycosyltransferase involved in cell wall biosynthesis
MKIAYITGSVGHPSTTFVQDLIAGLSTSEHQVHVLVGSLAQGYAPPEHANVVPGKFYDRPWGVRLGGKLFPSLHPPAHGRSFRLSASATGRLTEALKALKPDVVYVEFASNAVMCVDILKSLDLPYLVHVHGLDVTVPVKHPRYKAELLRAFQNAGGIVAASQHIRRLLVLSGADEERIHVVRLAPKDFHAECKSAIEHRHEGPPSIVFLGRLTEKKHPIALLEAFRLTHRALPTARLTFIGDGPLRGELETRVKKHGMQSCVRLTGALPREEALPLMAGHQVFAQHNVTSPDGDQEGFAISHAEAALLELPVVSTLHNGIPEQVVEGVTGFLVCEHDYEAMAEKMILLLKSKDLRERLGKAGRDNILSLCGNRSRSREILTLMQNISQTQ